HRAHGDRHVRGGGAIRNLRKNPKRDTNCSYTKDSNRRNPSPSHPTNRRSSKGFQLPHKPGPRRNQRGALRRQDGRWMKPRLEPLALEPDRRSALGLRLTQQAVGNPEARARLAKKFHWSEASTNR